MHFLLINRFFGSEGSPTGRMLWDVAQNLATRKHEVTILTSTGRYTQSGGGELKASESFKTKYVRSIGRGRLLNWICFWLRAALSVSLLRWDRCVILTDPPFMPFAGWLARCLARRSGRIYWWTMDLYPEALNAAGILSAPSPVFRMLRGLNELGLSAVDGVIALGLRQRTRLAQYGRWCSDESFSIVVPPWDRRTLACVPPEKNRLIERFGWSGRKIALYAGNLGEGHSFREILEGAHELDRQKRNDWIVVFTVRGSRKGSLQAEARSLPNVKVMDYLPESEISDLLHAATVHLVSMSPGWEGVIVPSKIYGCLQTSAPILFIGPSESDTALEIEHLGRGIVLPPAASGTAVVAALDQLARPCWTGEPYRDLTGLESVVEFLTA